MERSEPTFVPEWLKNTTTSHQFQSSSLHSDEKVVTKATRNKSFVNINGNDLTRPSISEKTTSSYFRRTSSNGSSLSRSYSSFGRNNRDRDRDRDREWDIKEREKSDKSNRNRDYSDPLINILPSRFEKEGLRRSHSSVSSSKRESWPRKVGSDKSNNGRGVSGNVKISFERDFPSLGGEENGEIGRVPSPGLTTAIQSLPVGNVAVIGGDGWTSALAEVPVIVGTNGSVTAGVQPVQSTTSTASVSVTSGRNMAETLAQGPPRAQTAPQLSVGTQRLEELAVKQSRQLIPMTPSLPKALALNSSDKSKPKVTQSQLQNSPRPIPTTTKFEPPKTSTSSVGKLHVLKPSRERNNGLLTPKDTNNNNNNNNNNLSPTSVAKLPNSPLALPSSAPLRPTNPTPSVPDRKPGVVEKRPSSQAQSRNDFFNLMRKKSMTSNNNTTAPVVAGSSVVSVGDKGEGGCDDQVVVLDGSGGVHQTSVDDNGNGNGKILYSEEEEARFLRSLGWEDNTTADEEEGLTEEEITSFYRDVSKYLNLQAASKILKGTQTKFLMPLHSQLGKNGDISSDSKLES